MNQRSQKRYTKDTLYLQQFMTSKVAGEKRSSWLMSETLFKSVECLH